MARGREELRALRAAVRFLAQRHRAVHGPAPVRLFGARRGRPDRGRDPLAPPDGAAPGLLPRARARLRERVPVPERAAARRAPRAPPVRRRQDDARAMADGAGVRRRNRRHAERVAEVPEHLHSLRQPGAREARRPARLRPAHRLRPELARLHARDPAMLDHRPGGGRRRGARRESRRRAARGRHRRTAVRALASRGLFEQLGEKTMSNRSTPPFRADHVGSFLRPKYLLEAREQKAKGEISAGRAAQGRGQGDRRDRQVPGGRRPAERSPTASSAAPTSTSTSSSSSAASRPTSR